MAEGMPLIVLQIGEAGIALGVGPYGLYGVSFCNPPLPINRPDYKTRESVALCTLGVSFNPFGLF